MHTTQDVWPCSPGHITFSQQIILSLIHKTSCYILHRLLSSPAVIVNGDHEATVWYAYISDISIRKIYKPGYKLVTAANSVSCQHYVILERVVAVITLIIHSPILIAS